MAIRLRLKTFLLLVVLAVPAAAQEEGVSYTVDEIDNLLDQFKSLAKDRKQPEDDAITTLGELVQAYQYLDKKGDEAAKDEIKAKKSIVDRIAWGLRRRRRPQVNLECAKALGKLGNERGSKPLVRWMDRIVLDSKTPNPEWVEYGFLSLAAIGDERQALDLIFEYGPKARHVDYSVADKALGAVPYWKQLNPKNRKELYNRILQLLQSLEAGSRQSGKQQQVMKERYDRVRINGFKALQELAGEKKPFANIGQATEWWKTNKGGKWQPYVGLNHRKKAETKEEKKS